MFDLVRYPASLLAERLGCFWPILDPGRSGSEQMYPLHATIKSHSNAACRKIGVSGRKESRVVRP